MHSARDSVRYFPIEGAVEAFAPRTGLHVVYRGDETRHLVPLAPRAVLFGLSHACNLGCAFCSRDEAVRSTWDVGSATSFLRGLYELGVAEVSFGGGEPLAYRGFFDLIDALYERTALALHMTSNAVLLDDRAIARIEGKISEVRVSVYDDTPWDERIRALVGAGIRVSANVLVDPSNVRDVPALLHRLAELGARDAAVLAFVGSPDRVMHPEHDRALADAIVASPLPVKVSVCFGERLGVPLLHGAGCTAGTDFVTIDPDRRLKACSFADEGVVADSPSDVIAIWRREVALFSRAAPRVGCARFGALETRAVPVDGVSVHRAFFSNNSGACILVGKFEAVADATDLAALLAPGFRSGAPYTDAWRAIFEAEGIRARADECAPESIIALGSAVSFHTDMTLSDDFPSLRELVFRKGGLSVHDAIHEHGNVALLVGLRSSDPERTRAIAEKSLAEPFLRHGDDVYGALPITGAKDGTIDAYAPLLDALVHDTGSVRAGELVRAGKLVSTAAHIARAPEGPTWLFARFRDEAAAAHARHAISEDEGFVAGGRTYLLFANARPRPRLAGRLSHAGASVTSFRGARVFVTASFYARGRESTLVPEVVRDAVRARTQAPFSFESAAWRSAVVRLETATPREMLEATEGAAVALGLWAYTDVRSCAPLAAAMRRVRDDLVLLRRKP